MLTIQVTDIDPEEAERTSEELYRTLIKLAKEFDKLGDKRQVAKRIAENLQVLFKSPWRICACYSMKCACFLF